MPILPPGRREWEQVEEESIEIGDSLLWPPKNWRTYTRETRAVVTEYAAAKLEMKEGYKSIDRNTLLYKYNFLVLPNAILPPCEGHTKMLYHNFSTVKAIAMGESPLPLEVQQDIIKAFQPTQPMDLSHLSEVPLRLKKSST